MSNTRAARHIGRVRSTLAGTLAAALVTAGLVAVAGLSAPAAHADTAPADPGLPMTVSADPLPTVQVDGVVWKQVIVGTTVYVGGEFANARPAGAAAGTNLIPRSNFLAYNITTGDLITSFAPSFNAQVKDLAVSPDGTKLYVAGSFTSVNGTARYRAAQFDLSSGALTNWKPTPNSTVNAIAATNSTVILGGSFGVVNNTARVNVAAVSSAPAATLQPLNPTMNDGSVQDAAVSPDGSQVVIAGNFTSVNGSNAPGYGLARLDIATSASLALPINTQVRNAGAQSAVLSLETDGTNFYGSGYHFGGGGNMEGAFSADWATGTIRWIEDCHGDTYSAYPVGGVVYEASHKHYCGNSGGFPQTTPWTFHHSTAVTNDVRGTNTRDIYGYPDHVGQPRPEFLDWYPDWATGTYTGKGQAAWTVSGNSDYVLYGGEFPKVGNVAQQGLVRFARTGVAPNKVGPTLKSAKFNLQAVSVTGGAVRVSWPGNPDPDNASITYKLYRASTNDPPIYQNTVTSHFWQMPTNKYLDTGLTPGSTQRYRVVASDPFGNTALSDWVTVTVASGGTLSTYANGVLAGSPDHYWRLGEGTGTTSYDWSGSSDLTRSAGVGWASTGAITGDTDGASTFTGTSTGLAATSEQVVAPNTFSIEAWFKTSTTSGGKIVGFGNAASGTSGSYDRHVYMTNAGKLIFGVYNNTVSTLATPKSYNDNSWHHVVAELSSAGMVLYVDGTRVARRTDVTQGQDYSGYWRVGGDNLGSWTSQPSSGYFNGSIDDVAIYPTALSTTSVQQHYTDSGRSTSAPAVPTDAYGKAVYQADPDLYWRFAEPAGATVADSSQAGGVGGNLAGSYTRGAGGPLAGVPTTASAGVGFSGTQGSTGASSVTFTSPQVYSLEAWFKTTSTTGGKVIGFGNAATGNSSNYDRHVYLQNDGKVVYGIYNGGTNTITSTGAYNDGSWHQVVATQGPGGMKLYLDGVLQGTNAASQAEGTTGYWRIGGDVTWGSSSNYLAGTIAEVAVYPSVIDAAAVTNHYVLGTTGQLPNQAPAAAFTSSVDKLAVSFDGSGSHDPDGSIASYAWDFGDGANGTGASAAHTYAAAGPYPVTLTVTDDRGASDTVTHQVTAVANQAPVAEFTVVPTGRTVAVDGSSSTDPDGSVSSYAWDFGDGGVATGATASHSYATDGTYTVTLDVVDNDGTHTSLTHDVTVTAPVDPNLATDAFGRTVSGGWGSADTGGAWTSVGTASRFAVASGRGVQTLPAGATDDSRLNSVNARDVDVRASVGLDKVPASNYIFAILGARQSGTQTGYAARVRFNPDGTVGVHLLQDNTPLVGASTVPGISVAAGERLQVRFQTEGAPTTTLRVKIWKDGTAEPAAWTYTRNDTTAANQVAGAIALRSFSPTTGNSPIAVSWDDLAVVALP